MKYVAMFLSLLVLSSCSTVFFEEVQPLNTDNLRSFPKNLQGYYVDDDKDTVIIQSDGFYLPMMNDREQNAWVQLSDSVVLRNAFQGYLLNLRSEKKWQPFYLNEKNNGLEVSMINADNAETIKALKSITRVEILSEGQESTEYLIKPSKVEMDEIFYSGLFEPIGYFRKLESK